MAALDCEVVMTMFFLLVILGATAKRAPMGFAGIPIGLALTLVRLAMLAAAMVTLVDHRAALRDLELPAGSVWRRWMTYSRLAERLVGRSETWQED